MRNSERFFEVEIIKDGKYYNILSTYEVGILKNGKRYNIFVLDKKYEQVKNSPKYEEGVVKIWLRKEPKEGYFVPILKRVSAFKCEKLTNQDRGHLIARMFKKYLLTSSELKKNREKVNDFF